MNNFGQILLKQWRETNPCVDVSTCVEIHNQRTNPFVPDGNPNQHPTVRATLVTSLSSWKPVWPQYITIHDVLLFQTRPILEPWVVLSACFHPILPNFRAKNKNMFKPQNNHGFQSFSWHFMAHLVKSPPLYPFFVHIKIAGIYGCSSCSSPYKLLLIAIDP